MKRNPRKLKDNRNEMREKGDSGDISTWVEGPDRKKSGNNTLEITQASLTGLELEAKYMKGVVASVEEVDSQGLDNNVSVSLS
jgi:hypothetical protein